jgi:hypothetical protein
MNMRPRVSIFDTLTTRTTVNPTQLRELVTFIVMNRGARLNALDVRSLMTAKSLTITPISALFNRAVELRKDTLFSFMRVPAAVPAPEVVTYRHVAFDLKQLATASGTAELYKTVKIIPDLADTIFENVTPLLRGNGELTDSLAFQSTIVRDLLVRSYYDNTAQVWLTPSLLRYLCRFYNMSMSSKIGSVFNLTFQEQQAVATVFSLYFLQMVSDSETAEVITKTAKLDLGPPEQLTSVISRLKDVLGDSYTTMTLDDVCKGIGGLGINRLNINRRFVYTQNRALGSDAMTSAMAIEYPPYWVYLVLCTMSGRKMGLTNVFKRNDIAREAPTFATDLLNSQSFLPSL